MDSVYTKILVYHVVLPIALNAKILTFALHASTTTF